MRISLVRQAAACAALLVFAPLQIQAQSDVAAGATSPARVIVKFRADSVLLSADTLPASAKPAARASALAVRIGRPLTSGAPVSEHAQVVFASGMTSQELAQRLAQESDVEYAVPDIRRHLVAAPNDPLYAAGVGGNGPAVGQWYLRAPDSVVLSSINVEPAWAITTGSPGVVVADVDTGIRYEHPDLLAIAAGGNLLPGYDMISDIPTANDGDGRDADASDPGDWVTQAEISQVGGPFYQCQDSPSDSSWHGTQVSGLIAALTNNSIGMASVGRNVRVLPVRAVGKCGGYDSDIIAAMLWAAGLSVPGVPANPYPAKVINLSLGGDGACPASYTQAISSITATGAAVVVAAGNSAGHALGAPANCAGVITVAGLRHVGTKVGFSDLGPEVALSAPAGNCVNTDANSPCLYPILTTSNSGTTVPVSSIYTDAYNTSLGTSFSAPLVSGTIALMLSANPALSPAQIKILLQATARPFPPPGGLNSDGTPVPACMAPQFDAMGNPIDQLECNCTTTTCGAGMVDAGAAVAAAIGRSAFNVQGLWWATGGIESGWGINFAHQGTQVYATWYTYNTAGKAWWLSMLANESAPGGSTFAGPIYVDSGPPFNNFVGSGQPTAVGNGTLTFTDTNNGSFNYNVTAGGASNVAQTKSISRFDLGTGPQPSCTTGSAPNFAAATNYQDLWWATGGTEPGWGINFAHQGSSIYATWYTYDIDGTPMWLSALTQRIGATNTYSGALLRTSGPRFDAYRTTDLAPDQNVGTATLSFADGNNATFTYAMNGAGGLPAVTQTKSVTRFLFAAPAGTLCQ